MSRGAKITIGVVAGVVLIALVALAVWWFQPGPAISVQLIASPQSRSGVLIQVAGAHFPANREIYIGLAAPGAPPTAGTSFVSVVSGGDGSFVAPFPFPNDPNWMGLPEVSVYAGTPEGDAVATTWLSLSSLAALIAVPTTASPATVTPAPLPSATPAPGTPTSTAVPVSVISLQPPSGQVGTTVQVTGRGWRPNDVVSLYLAALQGLRLVGATNVDAQGNFTAVFVFPTDWGGPAVTTVVVSSSDGNLQASAIFQVLNLVSPTSTPAVPTSTPVVPTSTPVVIFNWKGEYYSNPMLAGNPAFIRDDTSVDFDWGVIAPGSGVPNEHWSARWARLLHMPAANYRFFASADDGVRVWFDNRLIIDQWHAATGIQYQADVPGVPNGNHSIKVEFYQDTGPAYMHFWWQQYVPPTATATPTVAASPTPTNTLAPTSTFTSTSTPAPTNTPTSTSTSAPTSTSTPTPTSTP